MKKTVKVYILIIFISIFFISCTKIEKQEKNIENNKVPETFLKNDINIKTSEYYTKDGILVFKNYFENGELTKQEIFDNKGNIDYTFEINDEKIYSIKNSDGQKVSTNKIYYYYNNISHTKELLPLNKIFTFEDYLNSAKNKKEKFSLYDQLDPGQYTYGYRIDTSQTGYTDGEMSRKIFNATLNTILNIATNKIVNSIASKLRNIIEYIQYTGDFISYLRSNFVITGTLTEEARHYTLKKVYVIHYVSDKNGNWKKSWKKLFVVAERNYSSLRVIVKGKIKYKYNDNGTIETREKLDGTVITKENLDIKDSPNYNKLSKLCLIAKENYLNYINGGIYNVWYEKP
ncbi:hypothetical protein X275_10940 [Marinitoga sp. 1197]|uniref:hypothetical protein n=1 Tax=Marinitoga sp. 1197 TaxID=1428449 RepID=UPI000641595F|nr:hypothetical protein [Marinitoga sp. 1197]KLO20903.1 hypothetical protein X275_10940 [Marinitoga sp. 1197]